MKFKEFQASTRAQGRFTGAWAEVTSECCTEDSMAQFAGKASAWEAGSSEDSLNSSSETHDCAPRSRI